MSRKIGELFYELRTSSEALNGDLKDAERQLTKFTEFVKANPIVAVTGLAAAFAGVAFQASQAASQIDSQFRVAVNTLNASGEEAARLREDLRELSLESGRSQQELAGLFASIAEGGPNGAANVRAIADAAIALSDVLGGSAQSNAGAIDAITDIFAIDPANARTIAAVVAEIAAGRVPIGDVVAALSKIGPDAAALGLTFEQTVSFLTQFLDQGFSVKRVSTLFKEFADQGAEGRAQIERLAGAAVNTALALENFNAKQASVIASQEKQEEILKNRLNNQWIRFGETVRGPVVSGLTILNNILDGTYARLVGVGDGADRAADRLLRVNEAARSKAIDDLGITSQSGRDARSILGLQVDARLGPTIAANLTSQSSALNGSPLFGGPIFGASDAGIETTLADLGKRLAAVQSATKDLERLTLAQLQANARELDTIIAASGNELQVTKAKELQETVAKAIIAKTKDIADASQKATAEIQRTREAAAALFASFGETTPATRGADAIANWEKTAREAGESAQELTATVARLRGALDTSLRTEEAKKTADTLRELAARLRDVQAEASGDALQVLDASYARITEELLKAADAASKAARSADELGNPEAAAQARALAESYRVQFLAAQEQKRQLKELEELSRRAAAARQVEADFANIANANYRGLTVTIAELRRVEAERLALLTRLNAIIADPNTDPKAKAEAQKQLNELTRDQAKGQQEVTVEASKSAQLTEQFGSGILRSAQAALSLVQILGKGNSELGAMLSGVVSVGQGLSGLGAAATKAGGFGALFSSGTGIASALGPIAAIAGGAVALVGALSKSGEEARQRAAELKKASDEFNANLRTFVRDIAEQDLSAFAEARNALAEQIGKLVAGAAKAAGLDPANFTDTRQTAESLQGLLDAVGAQIATLQGQIESADAYQLPGLAAEFTRLTRFSDELTKALAAAADAEAQLSKQQAEKVRQLRDDLDVRRLEAAGRRDEAAALREQRAGQREVNEAIKEFSSAEGGPEFVSELREIIAAEQAASAALRRITQALADLSDLEAFYPELTGENLSGLTATGARLWPEIFNAAFGDLDLRTLDGLTAAKAKIREIYNTIAADGIDESERPIVDFLKTFFGGVTDAIDTFGDPILDAIEAYGVQAENAGFTAAQKFQGYGAFLKLNTEGLSAILGDTFQQDVQSGAGRAALEARIRKGISDIVADGKITDAERPLLEALQQLLALMLAAIDEAATEAQQEADRLAAEAAQRESTRQKTTRDRATNTSLDIALGDLTGADAVRATVEQYGDAFASLFQAFDLNTLEGIDGATARLGTLRSALAAMTDEEIVARFGLTRDEVISAILDLDTGLDGLGASLSELASAQGQFLNDLTVEFLNATGRGLEAVRLQSQLWVESMIAQATALGVLTPEIERQIRTVGQSRISSAEQQERDARERDANGAVSVSTSRSTARVRNTQLVGDFGGLSELTAQTLAGLQREAVLYAARTAAAAEGLYAVLRGGLPTPPTALLRFAGGGTSGAAAAGAGGFSIGSIVVTIGTIAPGGLTPAQAGRETADHIFEELGRRASQQARFLGTARRS